MSPQHLETLASTIADNDWVGLAFSDEEAPADSLARAQQDIAVKENKENFKINDGKNDNQLEYALNLLKK